MKTIKRQLIMRSIVAMTALFLFLLAGSSHTLSFAHTKDESVYILCHFV